MTNLGKYWGLFSIVDRKHLQSMSNDQRIGGTGLPSDRVPIEQLFMLDRDKILDLAGQCVTCNNCQRIKKIILDKDKRDGESNNNPGTIRKPASGRRRKS